VGDIGTRKQVELGRAAGRSPIAEEDGNLEVSKPNALIGSANLNTRTLGTEEELWLDGGAVGDVERQQDTADRLDLIREGNVQELIAAGVDLAQVDAARDAESESLRPRTTRAGST
jgi:hypothetical protein